MKGDAVDSASRDDGSSHEGVTLKAEREPDLRYGCFGCRPRCLQGINTVGGFVGWLCLANAIQSTLGGLIGVVLSTLEKRFDFSSSESSWLASTLELGPIPVLLAVSYFGNRIHRPLSCSVGLFTMAVGCTLFFIPQFTTPRYIPNTQDGEDGNDVCFPGSNRTSGCSVDSEDLSGYLPIFVVGCLAMGMGLAPIITLGITFIDDCTSRGKFALYSGIFNSMVIIGPSLGYVFGSLMLNIYVDFYAVDTSEIDVSPGDSLWIGAWWLPFTIAAAVSLLSAIPIAGYARDLPGAAEIRKAKISEAHNDVLGGENSSEVAVTRTWDDFKQNFKGVFTNPTYLCLTLYTSCNNFIIAGFTAFGPKVLEVNFNMTPAVAGVIFGVVLMPAGAGGTIVGGVIIDKLKLTCQKINRIQAVLYSLVTAGMCLLLLSCNQIKFPGVNWTYNTSLTEPSSETFNVTDACNIGCGCQFVAYNPICSHDNFMYYSPCHAGCRLMQDDGETKTYYDCSCIADLESSNSSEATSEPCSPDSCWVSILFMIAFFIAVAFIFVCDTMNISATLRCVTSSQTSLALGVQVLFTRLPGTTLGPLCFGMAFDKTCILWQYDECGTRGNCLAYDNDSFTINLFAVCFTVALIALISLIMAVILYKPPASVGVHEKDILPNDDNIQVQVASISFEGNGQTPREYEELGYFENLHSKTEASKTVASSVDGYSNESFEGNDTRL